MTPDLSDGITAYISGGFGNQLFVYAAAFEQSRRLGCPLYLDCSGYRPEAGNRRVYELDDLELPGTVFTEGSLIGRPQAPSRLRRLLDRRSPDERVFIERAHGYDPRIEDVHVGQTLYGYFQAHRYFAASASALFDLLGAPSASSDTISVHIRRGDYLLPAHESHGLASRAYFDRAIPLMREKYGDMPLRIFTDSPELMAEELDGLEHPFEIAPNSPDLTSWDTVKLMAQGRGIVMSNSSFSWWAAWLIRRRDPSARTIAPRPWTADGASAHDLLFEDWISLGIR